MRIHFNVQFSLSWSISSCLTVFSFLSPALVLLSFSPFFQRPSAARDPPPSKRQKLSHPPPTTHTPSSKKPSPPPSSKSSSAPRLNMPLFGMDTSNSANPSSNIEMQSFSSSVLSSHSHASNQNPSVAKPQTQYPGLIFSNFVRSSSSSLHHPSPSLPPSSSLPHPSPSLPPSSSLHHPPHSVAQSNVPDVHSSARSSTKHEHQHSQPVSTGQSGLSAGQTSLGGPPSTDGEVGVAGLLPTTTGGGRLFGDLVQSGGTATSTESTTETAESAKKKKKKKNSHKTKGVSINTESKLNMERSNSRVMLCVVR